MSATFRRFYPFSPEHLMQRLELLREGSKETRRVVIDDMNNEIRIDLDQAANALGNGDFSLPIQRRFIREAGAIMNEIVRQYNDAGGNLNRYVPQNLYDMIDWRRY
jgi:hypothetical protein